ncbi:MAG: 30S ribosomal protein S9 [Deltaproteobacteria bacterium]|nr:MAG: 30S ribosomal protein S9 [Deltaproteobacteria bacterium]
MADVKYYYGTGKRKTSVARVFIKPGSGHITVNGRDFEEYFPLAPWRKVALSPLEFTGNLGKFDIKVNVRGGGISAQADAVKYGIAKALVAWQPDLRTPLKKARFLTRDARVKERKKYGQPGARKRFQFSKR